MDEYAEIAKYLGSGGVGGVVVGLIWAAITLWGKFRRVVGEDNSTTAAEWRKMAKDAWARVTIIEKKMDALRETHSVDIKACIEDRLRLTAQNMHQQEQLDHQAAEIAELTDHVAKLSGSFRSVKP